VQGETESAARPMSAEPVLRKPSDRVCKEAQSDPQARLAFGIGIWTPGAVLRFNIACFELGGFSISGSTRLCKQADGAV